MAVSHIEPVTPQTDALSSFSKWHLGFPPAIETRYEADTGAQRSRELQIAGLLAIAVYDSFLINDWISRPEVWMNAMFWRLGIVTVYGLAALILIERNLPAQWREATMASTAVVAMWASCEIFHATTSAAGAYDPFLFSLVFLAGNIVFQLRFVMALLSSALGLLVATAFLMAPSIMPAMARPFALGLLLGTAVFTVMAAYRLERSERQNYLLILREANRSEVARQAADRFATLSQTDALTHLANRRAFDMELPQRWAHANTNGENMTVILIDIDHFKRYNDHFGHPAGDICLQQVAKALREGLRESDFIARIGGEEFAVLFHGGSCDDAMQLAERLRLNIASAAIPHDRQHGQLVVTISVGLAITAPPCSLPPNELVAAADTALYSAKHSGRNRYVVWNPSSEA